LHKQKARPVFFLAVAVVWAAGLASAGPTVINFDSPPAGLTANSFFQGAPVDPTAEITNQFENLGILLSTASPGAPYAVLISLGVGHAVSGANGIGSANSSNQVDYTKDIDIFLVVPGVTTPAVTDMISIQGDEIPSGGLVIFSAYDVNGNLLTSGSQVDTAGGTYSLSAAGIHEFRLHSVNGDVAYDNLTFDVPTSPGSSGVPEPSTVLLVGSGAALLAAGRRRASVRHGAN
jgi:hypothetical protein